MSSATPCIVCDVGGTNARFAVFDPTDDTYRAVTSLRTSDFAGLEDALSDWLSELGEAIPDLCTVAVAAPLAGDKVAMLNCHWRFSRREVRERFGFRKFRCLNDFEATAYALPHLEGEQLFTLYAGRAGNGQRLATLGPGTGLGGACLADFGGTPYSLACEPGHMELAPQDELEAAILERVAAEHDYLFSELLVSGPGLVRLYRALCELSDHLVEPLEPDEITRRALQGGDELCEQVLQVFCALLGSLCGNFLLANGAFGGIYLAGGILPRMTGLLGDSQFHERMVAKGAMRATLEGVPVHVITAANPGLIGAAHAPWSCPA